MTLITTAMP